MVTRSRHDPPGSHQHRLFGTGGEGQRMASEPSRISGPVPTGEAARALSPDSDSTAAARSRRADSERVTRKNQEDFENTIKILADKKIGELNWIEYRELKKGAQAFKEIHDGTCSSPKIILLP